MVIRLFRTCGCSRLILTELHVPFWAYKNSSGCPKTLAIRQTGPEIGAGVVPFCACAKSGRYP